jgi:RNA polymerase sigma-70 factor (ECF subfamily)
MVEPSEIVAALDEVARGNRDAFRCIIRAYGLPLRSYLALRIHHLDDVDDLAQEIFLAAFRSLPTFRRGDDFGAWLRGIARHKMAKHLRSAALRDRTLDRFRAEVARAADADFERAATAHRAEAIETLLRCVDKLPEKLRRVVRAGLDGEKPAALADALATSVGAVYNLHYRANKLLRSCMLKELG